VTVLSVALSPVPAAVFELAGLRVPVAQLADLKAMKRASGRAKDEVDLTELDALGEPEGGEG